jgi:hypothetical protein
MVRFLAGAKLFTTVFGLGLGSIGLKWPGNEINHASPSDANVKNAWSYTFTPPSVFKEWSLIRHNRTLPIESFAHDSGCSLVHAEYGYPKGSPNTNS